MIVSSSLRCIVKNIKFSTRNDTRGYAHTFLKGRSPLSPSKNTIHPRKPVRTRFAPSPTGLLHLGSLRTALYNFLLAKQTKGQFVLRLEDTDQTRVVPGAEENVYEALKWAGIDADESPVVGGPYGPYKQSERAAIYKEYVDILLSKGLAYKCYCSKDRLISLRESAHKLQPPTTVTYDRKCLHDQSQGLESSDYVVRFKSPDVYPITEDLKRGKLDIQPQYNQQDRRFDDFVIMKLDGLPTYHFANVIDDHLMKIDYVIRGEEWLTSTPKHLALYQAFGWEPPKFVHVPLLTSLDEKKLSKRHGDVGVFAFRDKGVVPQALVNFVALFGWSPKRATNKAMKEVLTLPEMIERFRLDDMTKGNTKVSDSKLWFFNRSHLRSFPVLSSQLQELTELTFDDFAEQVSGSFDKDYYKKCLAATFGHIDKPSDVVKEHPYFFEDVDYSGIDVSQNQYMLKILEAARNELILERKPASVPALKELLPGQSAKEINESLRFALTGPVHGVKIHDIVEIIGNEKYLQRLENAIGYLESHKGK
ncbi:hypothetical protein PUMCH_001844 [Australozyma saopauloensis]|uniref:Glutamate--tRNA ligase, mitochondrial n=1 Tax=Australozyma saopauloensis TaxID=291208 RepID=A0AAX4H7K6_9ASCO|nr:hypothetical protein PUMCH_001844 [[Candida] saopauloensis]